MYHIFSKDRGSFVKERYFILKGLSIFNLKGFFFPQRSLIVIKEIKVSTDTFGSHSCVGGLVLFRASDILVGSISVTKRLVSLNQAVHLQGRKIRSVSFANEALNECLTCLNLCVRRELVEELHPLMKEALERRPEVA